ncbi:HIG1 domain family member 1A, mitochondrial-like [Tubulanus polymorphus]|uniref:HIG1 domain family member 1A, mitochondrial-like n=1 Tax=Tubulanus polymorphus TaxID=672921 RepID=UPI003DA23A9C
MSGGKAGDWDEEVSSKFMRKAKEAPFVPIGLAGLVAALGYGAYAYKNRGNVSTSVYLMSLRVRAQAMVVGAITIGVGYSLFKTFYEEHRPHPVENNKK